MTGVFTINYPATMAVIDRMTKLVEKLTRINERYESEISTLSRCRGTTENPHNHDSQIAAYRKIISNNSKDIVDLGLLISQIFSLMVNTQMTDFYLTQLIKNMMSGDSNVPNPETSVIGESLSEQAAKKAGVRVDSRGVPIINNGTDAQSYMDALNDILLKKENISVGVGLLVPNAGTTYSIDEITSPYLHTSGYGQTGIFSSHVYSVIDGLSISKPSSGTLTQSEYDYLVYITLHEAGGLYVEDPKAQMTAVASSFMNNYEGNGYNDFAKTMWNQCTQWATDPYTRDTLTDNLKKGSYSGLDFSNFSTEQIDVATKSVNTVLSGTRNTSPSTMYWVGDGTYNTFN